MGQPDYKTTTKSTESRGIWVGIAILFVAIMVCYGFYAAGQHAATCFVPDFGHKPSVMGAEKYLTEITDFYKCIISIQFAVIGIVLAVAFVYVHTVSKQQARDMATEALDSTSFRRELEHTQKDLEVRLRECVKEQWIDVKNSSNFEKIRVDQKELLKRVQFMEQVMNAYTSSDDKTGLELREPQSTEGD